MGNFAAALEAVHVSTMTSHTFSAVPRQWSRLAESPTFFESLKRLMDIAGALAGLLLIWPVLLGCALWIRIQDGGPVFYSQWRVGRGGWLFRIHKLRTMRRNAESLGQARWASDRDPRIIPGCRWMRKSHVDELPQFWNILCGQMSIVGPRPERPEMLDQLRPHMPRIDWRLASRPGLTGLAQVRAGYTNDLAGARRKLAYDLRYLRSRSVVGEIKLLLATVPKLWDRGAM